MEKSILQYTCSGGNRRSNSYHLAHKDLMEIQLFLSNISTLGRLPLTLIQIFSIDWKLCLEQLNCEPAEWKG